jgi:ubiquitin-like 1-activating enzyme E1 B
MKNLSEVKLLVVGAGGIGCELLKTLVLSGFTQIEVIDLDTIELSNLNRQFLFQKVHVGKPKAIIARESVLKYNPNAHIVAYHDSIMNPKYNVDYFKQFNIVLNALDNKAARSHVNRLCLAADVPLIESGSAGYLGQVTLIKRGQTECYDCLPKPPVKTFPGCTIRNTPSEPIHCIVWAKHLFNQLFGAEDPDEAVSPDGEDPENMSEAGKAAVNKDEVVRMSTRQWAKDTNYDAVKLFNKLFNDDIKYLLSMSKLWEKRKPPSPLNWEESINNNEIPLSENTNQEKLESHRLWSTSQCCQVFSESVRSLHSKLSESGETILCWDKDDEDSMNFVASAANLRCIIFSIVTKTKFEIKSLAGNIIPAIATTNAIVAGLIVLQAFKVLDECWDKCKTVYIRDKPSNNKLIVDSTLVKPNEKCYVCAFKPEINVKLNVNKFTMKQFETKILKHELNMVQPDVEIEDGSGRILISSEEGETEGNSFSIIFSSFMFYF